MYSSFSATTHSVMDAAWPFAKDIANCRPAARQVKKVTAKSKIASHSFFGFEEAEDCQVGAGELSGEAGFNSLAGGGNPFSLFTGVLDAMALRTERLLTLREDNGI